MGISCLDCVYLNDSSEKNLEAGKKDKYLDKLKRCFEFYELQIQMGKIKNYGISSWSDFRG